MWPQRWYASASPGFTSAATALPPATSASSRDVRARKPRRDVDTASPSPIAPASGSRGNDRLELAVSVERSLRPHCTDLVDDDGVRAAGNVEAPPDVCVAHLVEDVERDRRILSER